MPSDRDTSPREAPERVRLDKWLWAARFFKTRAIATEAVDKHRVRLNGADTKPSRELRPGDTLQITQGEVQRTVRVLALSAVRGPAPPAGLLYQETDESMAARALAAEARRLAPEPAQHLTQGRPTKRDRRSLDALRHGHTNPPWDDRWRAQVPGTPGGKSGSRP